MGNGDYISKLVNGVREGMVLSEKEEKEAFVPQEKTETNTVKIDVDVLLESIRDFEIKGNSKRLIRIDARNENILKHLNFLFGISVTSFVNFLCWDFLKSHPELVKEIKQSLKQLKL